MKAYTLIAPITAALLTFASISVINYNVAVQPAARLAHVTNLSPIHVYPSAEQLRAISSSVVEADSDTMIASAARASDANASASLTLVGSALTLPHYTSGQKFGRISKE